jgi:hypothetical protein
MSVFFYGFSYKCVKISCGNVNFLNHFTRKNVKNSLKFFRQKHKKKRKFSYEKNDFFFFFFSNFNSKNTEKKRKKKPKKPKKKHKTDRKPFRRRLNRKT